MDEPNYTAASTIVGQVRRRVPDWIEEQIEAGLWKFTATDPDWVVGDYGPNYILVDGRERAVFVLPEQFAPERMGPALIGFHAGVVTHICYAPMLDGGEIRSGLDALEEMSVLPMKGRGEAPS